MTSPDSPTGSDNRPRPQYGEYASPEEVVDATRAREPWPAPIVEPPAAVAPAAPITPAATPNRVDRVLTFALLAFGGFTTVYAIFTASAIAEGIQGVYAVYGIDATYTATGAEGPAAWIIGISHVLLLVGAMLLARRRLQRGRLAFWVPLVAGVIAAVIFFIVLSSVLAADPNLAEFLRSGVVPPAETP